MAIVKTKDELFKKVSEYMELNGISRYEEDIATRLRENTQGTNVEYSRDGMGSIILNKKGNGPKIMITAHMDEVGYMVLDVTKEGFVLISPVGGIWTPTVIGSKATIVTDEGKEYVGVFGHTSIHILEADKRAKAPLMKEMYVDLGTGSKEETEKLGIEPGNVINIFAESFRLANGDLFSGKAIDNRAGVAIIEQIAHRVKDKTLPNDLYLVGTVQEEVGTRGAITAVQVVKPNVAIAIDTCASHDTPGAMPGVPKVGKGIALRIKDGGTMMDPQLIKYLFKLAKKHNIPAYKYVAQGGGTDAAELQYGDGGTATITLSIPERYLHSPHGVASLSDVQAGLDLLTEFVLEFDDKAFDSISYK